MDRRHRWTATRGRLVRSGCGSMTGSGRPPHSDRWKSPQDKAPAQKCRHRNAPRNMTRRYIGGSGAATVYVNDPSAGRRRILVTDNSKRGRADLHFVGLEICGGGLEDCLQTIARIAALSGLKMIGTNDTSHSEARDILKRVPHGITCDDGV